MVICMILLAWLPSALTKSHSCWPQALLEPVGGEGLPLPNGPWMAELNGCGERARATSTSEQVGPTPLVPSAVRGCRAVLPQAGCGRTGSLALVKFLHGPHSSELTGCNFSLATGKFSSLPFLNLFAARDFKSNVFLQTFPEKADLHMH